jgi:riboflavin synthase
MFTGIVEEVGQTLATRFNQAHPRLTIGCRAVVTDAHVGDSIAVEGVCLTVEEFDAASFTVGLMPETLRRTALGSLRPGALVNLERSLAANGRIGGHIVQGHVDGTGQIVARQPEGEALLVTIAAPPALARYIVEKGFIAVDGASLTVVEVSDAAFSVSLVRHTQAHTTLAGKAIGDPVNLEVDILGKYVERLLGQMAGGQPGPADLRLVGAAVGEESHGAGDHR